MSENNAHQPRAPVVRLRGISKSFGGTQAVNLVDLDILPGEVHALVGENGAGKSTLMRILSGFYPDYEGQIVIEGKPSTIGTPRQAQSMGIALVHQELSLVPELTVAENILLGKEPAAKIPGFISRKKISEQAQKFLSEIAAAIDPQEKISSLSVAYRQMVEIAKGLSINPKVLILDEPTSSLTTTEINELFRVIKSLAARGTAIVYISHKMDEIFAIADRITVMRDGAKVATDTVDKWNETALVKAMVGRELSSLFPHNHVPDLGKTALEVRSLSRKEAFRSVTFLLHEREVLGIYGLVGAGRSEIAESLFGLCPADSGEIKVFGQSVRIRSPQAALAAGLALVPEDRRGRGLILMHAVGTNITLPVLRHISRLGFVKRHEEREQVQKIIDALDIHTASADVACETLSGGNQQKVVIGKWLVRPPRILILDEPTRGIDVAAKAEVHALIDKLAGEGMAILLISSELPEILGMSDRIMVMREGEIVGEFAGNQATQENLCAAAAACILEEANTAGAKS